MPPTNQGTRSVTAENRSSGIQPLHQGDGNLAVQAGEESIQNNVGHQNYFHNSTITKNYHYAVEKISAQPTKGDVIDWMTRGLSGQDQVILHRALLAEHVTGTGTWILDSPEFASWKDDTSNLLWMHGDLGSGKTTLACFMIDSIGRQNRNGNVACICLYFRSTPISFEQIVIELLKQLVEQQRGEEICEELIETYNEWRRNRKYPSTKRYIDLIRIVSETFSKVYLIFDALDDCINVDGESTQELVQDLVQSLRSEIKILVTSRSNVLNEEHLKPDVALRIVPNIHDIKLYVRSRIDNDKFMREELEQSNQPGIQDDIVEKVADATKGIFLMTKLDMDYLCQQGSVGLVKSALLQLPRSVHSAFETSIHQIEGRDAAENLACLRGLAQHTLTWITNSATPLDAQQISFSFAIGYCKKSFDRDYVPSTLRVMSACAGLVTMDYETGMLRLIHESVGQYLVEHQIIPKKAHTLMVKTCLNCLSLDDAPNAVLKYCASHWFTHFLHAKKEGSDLEIEDLASKFLNNNDKVERAFRCLPNQQNDNAHGMTGLHASVYYGETRWALAIIENAADTQMCLDATCSDGQTALHWAAKYGRELMVELLIQKGAGLNVRDRDGDSPLHVALMCSTIHCEGVVKRLVAAGARSDIRGRKGRTPLAWTIRYGPPSITEMLAQSPEVVNAEDDLGWTSLREAISQAQTDIVYLLLKNGADPNRASSKDDWTPLKAAVQDGDEIMARHLIASGARINDPDGELGYSPLRWAIRYNHADIVHLLIKNGANLDAKAKDNTTPLMAAITERKRRVSNKSIVWMLLEHGACPDEHGENGWTALHYAIHNSDRSMAWLLISKGASVNKRDDKHLTPLDWAVERGDLSLCWLLCEHGAKADTPGHKEFTSLHRAAALGHIKIVHYFLTHDIDINKPDELGNTAIDHAVSRDRIEVINLLASSGAMLDRQNGQGSTVLHTAIRKRNLNMVEMLLDHGASCHIRDNSGQTVLHRAAKAGFSDGLALLIRSSKALDLTNDDGATALHLGVFKGDESSVKLLVDGGASRTVKDCYGMQPLGYARQLGHTHLMTYLV